MNLRRFKIVSLLIVCVASLSPVATPKALGADLEWSGFRGPNGSGVASATNLPVEFGPDKNLAWVADVPFGRSSPVISDKRIFLTAVDGDKLVTLALDRKTGKEAWRWELERAERAEFHSATDSATPSPVTDGENVYAFFQEAGLVSYDGNGKERWRLPLGPFRNFYGIAASPILAGNLLFMLCDQAEGSFLLAVDKDRGELRWRQERPGRLEAYTTPILYPDTANPQAVVVSGSRWVDAYDPATGEVLWSTSGVGSGPVSSPALVGDMLYVSAIDHAESGWAPFAPLLEKHDEDGDGELSRDDVEGMWIAKHFGWLNSDGEGNITLDDWSRVEREMVNENWGVHALEIGDGGAKQRWNYKKNVPYIPSPLVYDGLFYMVQDDKVTTLDPKTGELVKRDRLGTSKPKVYASPVAAGGKIYIGTMDGDVVVLEAGRDWKVLATNSLGEEVWATPAVAGEHLYVRTRGKIYAFAQAAAAGEAPEETTDSGEVPSAP